MLRLVFFQRSLGADIIGWSPRNSMNGQNAARLPIVFRDEVSKFDCDDVRGPALRRPCAGRRRPKAPVRSGWSIDVGASAGRRVYTHRPDREWRHCFPLGMPGNDREAAGPNLGQPSCSIEQSAVTRAVAVTGCPERGYGRNRDDGAAQGRQGRGDGGRRCRAAGVQRGICTREAACAPEADFRCWPIPCRAQGAACRAAIAPGEQRRCEDEGQGRVAARCCSEVAHRPRAADHEDCAHQRPGAQFSASSWPSEI